MAHQSATMIKIEHGAEIIFKITGKKTIRINVFESNNFLLIDNTTKTITNKCTVFEDPDLHH